MASTLKDIAEKANVSKSTASKALNDYRGEVSSEVKDKVIKIAKELGYQPNSSARSLRIKKTNAVGLVIPLPTVYVITSPYFVELILSVEKNLKAKGYHLIFSTFDTKEKQEIVLSNIFDKSKLDGLLMVGSPIDDQYIKRLDESDFKVVLIGRYYGLKRIKWVDINNKTSAYEAVKYLLNLGHKNIGFIGGPKNFYNRRDREEGYKEALKEYGIDFNEQYIKEIDLTETEGERVMGEMLSLKERPTAVLTHNDGTAAGAMKAAGKKGLSVPDDLSVMSFSDGTKLADTNPPLTTMKIPVDKISEEAAKSLIDMIENRNLADIKNIELKTELVVRGTTIKAI